jgi:nucleoside-diphosphate-sugar epimerase
MNNKLTIGITGAGGHIGSQLTEYLRAKAFEVIVLTKKARKMLIQLKIHLQGSMILLTRLQMIS